MKDFYFDSVYIINDNLQKKKLYVIYMYIYIKREKKNFYITYKSSSFIVKTINRNIYLYKYILIYCNSI